MSQVNYRLARYLTSATQLQQCPPEQGAEVAFAGRSNAGKSSAINCLTGNSKLARTSKTPGRTQMINFFSLGEPDIRLVDLPGYGYAKVAKKLKEQWQRHLSEYLYKRDSLKGLVLVMDIRHPLQEYDTLMINWAIDRGLATHLLLTKSDKLKRGACKNTLIEVTRHMGESNVGDLVSVQTFSALKKEGLHTLEQKVAGWLEQGVKKPGSLGETAGLNDAPD